MTRGIDRGDWEASNIHDGHHDGVAGQSLTKDDIARMMLLSESGQGSFGLLSPDEASSSEALLPPVAGQEDMIIGGTNIPGAGTAF